VSPSSSTHPQDGSVAEVAIIAAGIAASVGAMVTCTMPSWSIPAAIATPFVAAFAGLACGVVVHRRRHRVFQELSVDGLYKDPPTLVPSPDRTDSVHAEAPYMTVPAEAA
jgi:hypothetical protein